MPIHESKHCKRCDTNKISAEFYRRRKGTDLSPYCKACTKEQTIERQRALKLRAVAYKGGRCEKCGYDKCPGAFDFHHTDPTEKEFSIAPKMRKGWTQELVRELDKCALLCATCHREEHWEEKEFINLSPKQPAKIHTCVECSATLYDGKASRCVPCSLKKKEKIEWPTTDKLLLMIEKANYSAVARTLGVSDNAVRKRIRNHPIST
tara:strand:+ start:99 stop:719 length:621 start_codon:yes stop_codon:yes gene_type:complete